MIYIETHSNNPYYNLAFEEYFFKFSSLKEDILLLWQNEPVVVVGKNQNTWEEVNMDYVKEKKIHVVRRITGGGAVYHDLGNINFSVIRTINDKRGMDFKVFTLPVIECLKECGVNAIFSGRNDILIDEKKFSGNAQCFYQDKVLHHGTLLFASDLSVLSAALNPNRAKIVSKGVKSVISRVTNISDCLPQKMSIDEFREKLISVFSQQTVLYQPTALELMAIDELTKTKYMTDDWNFGAFRRTNFTKKIKFPAGIIEIKMNFLDGKIENMFIEGDFFETEKNIDQLKNQFMGQAYDLETIQKILDSIQIKDYIHNLNNQEFALLLF